MARATLWLALALAIMPQLALADETRSAPAGHVPPAASVDSLDWLAGHWAGTGIGGDPAFETYSPPVSGAIVGHFAQLDDQGAIAFSEYVHIAKEGESLAFRLKHFNPDLTGWESREEVVNFPLVALEDGAAYFDGLTLRREGETGLVTAVRIRGKDGSTGELVFRYQKTGLASQDHGAVIRSGQGAP
jgi:hypothetical protein